ncbi:MAG: permease [Flavobacterium sp. BFFFF2]|nr:MAG: permease [Flavobacterium sp. BFFFF2]
MVIVGYIFSVFIGGTLGLLGSGGSILAVPLLMYCFGQTPTEATGNSLLIVGICASIGSFFKAQQKEIVYKELIWVGIPAMLGAFVVRKWAIPSIPTEIVIGNLGSITKDLLILTVFCLVMLLAAYNMIAVKSAPNATAAASHWKASLAGLGIGLLAGFVGAGGGFLMVPGLVFWVRLNMKQAIGTSLALVALQSLTGFLANASTPQHLHWTMLAGIIACALVGMFVGLKVSRRIKAQPLQKGFGWFMLVVASFIFIKSWLG